MGDPREDFGRLASPHEVVDPEPKVGADDFVDFLHYLAGHRAYSAAAIIHVVEKPHNYGPEYLDYLAEGGLDRG